ncbi:hypothetical protein [Dyadobacter sp. CY312]|uniref:hypothetical protein n=1 Tax=Dyadobacter sp. CY312 TaxID=2907303 RepID=UPI001F42F43B|nr:hypothetical protein [Dyadobacter sp. CY312]MCE7044130.1 hypothetical protein [Dyadobacter sp. CY312]
MPPSYVSELLGTYQSRNESKDVYGGTSTIFTQMEITKSTSSINAVDLAYIRSVKRYIGTTELTDQAQTWGTWKFKDVTVNEMMVIDHKETQFTNFGGQPGESVETILSIKGGLVGTTLTLNIGNDYPSKNLINGSMVWLDKVN